MFIFYKGRILLCIRRTARFCRTLLLVRSFVVVGGRLTVALRGSIRRTGGTLVALNARRARVI